MTIETHFQAYVLTDVFGGTQSVLLQAVSELK